MQWPLIQTGQTADPQVQKTMSTGNGLMHPLIHSAKKKGVVFLLEPNIDDNTDSGKEPTSGPVLGVVAMHQDKEIRIRAKRAVILGTGGSTSNVNFRRMFDPRLTEEYWRAWPARPGLTKMPVEKLRPWALALHFGVFITTRVNSAQASPSQAPLVGNMAMSISNSFQAVKSLTKLERLV
jgi:hypothetical protein